MGRRLVSREFKLEALRLVRERGVSVVQACRGWTLGRVCCRAGSRN
jgi:transposase-like protein